MALVKFYAGTLANYQGLASKDANALYFITDSNPPLLYKGDKLYTKNWIAVETLPTSGQIQGVLYLNAADGAIYSWSGTAWTAVTKPATNAVTEGSEALVTSGAVFTAIQNAVKDLTGGSVLVKDVEASETAGKIRVTTGAGSTEFAVKGVIVNPTYEAETRKLVFPYADGTASLEVNLGKDMVVTSGVYNAETKEIELTLTSGDKVKVPVESLVDIYTGEGTNSATVAVSTDNKITVTVKTATAGANEHNDLAVRADGLFVDVQTPVAAALASAKEYADGKIGTLDGDNAGKTVNEVLKAIQSDVATNTGNIGTLNGDASTPGSVAKAKADAVSEAQTYTDTALTWQTI